MKNSFKIMATMLATMLMAGVAMADSVDIGMGRMDRAEFEALKQMVRGDYRPSASVTTKVSGERHVAEFKVSDVEAIRQAMAANTVKREAVASAADEGMVDIGTGTMSTSEFCDLNKLVASNFTNRDAGFTSICP